MDLRPRHWEGRAGPPFETPRQRRNSGISRAGTLSITQRVAYGRKPSFQAALHRHSLAQGGIQLLNRKP